MQAIRSVARIAADMDDKRKYGHGWKPSDCHNPRVPIITALDKLADALPDSGYSMGETKTVNLISSTGNMLLQGQRDNTDEYKGSKWHALHGTVAIDITADDYLHASVIEGVVTVTGKIVEHYKQMTIREAKWVKRTGLKQYMTIEWVNGYMVDQLRFHAETLETAYDVIRQSINERIEAIRDTQREALIRGHMYSALKSAYGLTDSLDAGNCLPGTQAWADRAGLDITRKYLGIELLRAAKKADSRERVMDIIRRRALQIAKSH